MEYQLPKLKYYGEERMVRATQFMYVPDLRIDDFNDAIAKEFADTIQGAKDAGEPFEETPEAYGELYNEIMRDLAYKYLEEDDFDVDDVIDNFDDYVFEDDKGDVVFLDADGKPIPPVFDEHEHI